MAPPPRWPELAKFSYGQQISRRDGAQPGAAQGGGRPRSDRGRGQRGDRGLQGYRCERQRTIDSGDLGQKLSDLGVAGRDIERLQLMLDVNMDGEIDLQEFIDGYVHYKKVVAGGGSRSQRADTDNSKTIDVDEFRGVLDTLGMKVRPEEFNSLVKVHFAKIDKDGETPSSEGGSGRLFFASPARPPTPPHCNSFRPLACPPSHPSTLLPSGHWSDSMLSVVGTALHGAHAGSNSLDFDEFKRFYRRCLASDELRRKFAKKARKSGQKGLRQEQESRARWVFKQYGACAMGRTAGWWKSCATSPADALPVHCGRLGRAAMADSVLARTDNDGSGTIDGGELKKLVRELMPELKLDQASWDDLVKSVSAAGDKDGNGECLVGWRLCPSACRVGARLQPAGSGY
eukprot:SAG22_NODE_2333_length_2707_cov_1.282209_1_plen_402_part_00